MKWGSKVKRTACIFYASTFVVLSLATVAAAQTTPAELIDMSLEDLLDLDISESDVKTKKKHWEFNLSYTKGSFGGYKSGTTEFSFQDVLFSQGEMRSDQNYPIVPTFICQNAFNASASYHISDRTSLSVSVPYITQSTDHISSVPGFQEFILKTEGIGDIAVALAHGKKLSNNDNLTSVIGVRLPVGSINETGDTPRNGPNTLERLPYTMQLGSGTLDLTGSLTYLRNDKDFSLGANVNGVLRTGKNDNHYRLGNNIGTSVFARYNKHHQFQPGIRLSARHIGRISGGDISLETAGPFPFPASITDPSNYGGEKVSATATVRSCVKSDCLLSFSAEYSKPIYQNLNGIQPMERNSFSLGTALKF
ncbi:MAG: hypothetical protein ABJN69_05000 [Hellea sp.]